MADINSSSDTLFLWQLSFPEFSKLLLENNVSNETFPALMNNFATNITEESYFIDTLYGSRFIPYTILSVACVIINVISVVTILYVQGRRSVHHTLLVNLAVSDILGSVLLWMFYSAPLLFPPFRTTTLGDCVFISVILTSPYIFSLCSSILLLLMLAVNQYLSICQPLWYGTHTTKGTICICIVCAWLLSMVLATIPAFCMLAMTRQQQCMFFAHDMAIHTLEICACGLAGLIMIIIALYVQIYQKVREYRDEHAQISQPRGTKHDSESNLKAFTTVVYLTSALVIFWFPCIVLDIIPAHVEIDSISDEFINFKFYVVTVLPLLNILANPIVYGVHTTKIREVYWYVFNDVLFGRVLAIKAVITFHSFRLPTRKGPVVAL